MKKLLGTLASCLILVVIVSYMRMRWHEVAVTSAAQVVRTSDPQASYEEVKEAQSMVTLTGPLADYMTRHQDGHVETLEAPRAVYTGKPTAADHVAGDSPVGTSVQLLHKTFAVDDIVNLPFEIPAHAATPQLHGTYRSFVQQQGKLRQAAESDDDSTNVEFLVLTEQQFIDMLGGRPVDALFSADEAHYQEVNASIPPTWTGAAKYYLIFRNNQRNNQRGKVHKVVQADFRLDF